MDNIYSKFLIIPCLFSSKGLKLLAYIAVLIIGLIGLFALLIASVSGAQAKSRIKDIVSIEGVRDNILIGYGLVVGLNGTGDKMNNSVFTEKSLRAFLERIGVSISDTKNLKVKNVAAVIVTTTLPAFARSGGRIDVTVSTLGDAKSLQGGMLIATPLLGADGQVYAVSQGAIAIGGFEAKGKSGSSVSKGVPTNGYISNGAIVEREIDFELNSLKTIKLALRNPDISTAQQIEEVINYQLSADIAKMTDPGTVVLSVPLESQNSVASLLASIEQLEVEPDQPARIIIDEASGTIVMNENVRIDTVAIAQGNLIVSITEEVAVSQPGAFSPEGAETIEVAQSTVTVTDEGAGNKIAVVESGANLRGLVNGLNALGVGPRDLITILQAVKAAGALQAEIEAR